MAVLEFSLCVVCFLFLHLTFLELPLVRSITWIHCGYNALCLKFLISDLQYIVNPHIHEPKEVNSF